MNFVQLVLWQAVKWALKNYVIDKVVDELSQELDHAAGRTDNTFDDSAAGKFRENKEDIKDWLKDRL